MHNFSFLILIVAALFPLISSHTFYNIYQSSESRDKFRGVTKNALMLAIATEKFVIFGVLHSNFTFMEAMKNPLTKNLIGKSKLLEFKFIGYDSVIICNNKECSICTILALHSVEQCTTIIDNSTIKSIHAESHMNFLFVRVVHEKSNAVIWSFRYENGKCSLIGISSDRTTSINEFESIASFISFEHVYFVTRVKRNNLDLCFNETKDDLMTNVEIVLTQVCNNDESDKIVSRRDLILSCGEMNSHNGTSYFDNNILYRNTSYNNIKVAAYSKNADKLFIIVEDSPAFSFICTFDMFAVEKEFCDIWNYCETVKNDASDNCETNEKFYENRCFKPSTTDNFCETNLKYHNYLTNNCNTKTTQNFHTLENLKPIYGKSVKSVIDESVQGLISNDQGAFMLQKNKLTKVTFYLSLNITTTHLLLQFPIESEKFITFWATKNGILYIDPTTKDTVYFKETHCHETLCIEVLYNYYIKCGICSLKHSNECILEEQAETLCAPLWYKLDRTEYLNPNKSISLTNLQTTYNGVSRMVSCVPVFDETVLTCSKTLKSYLKSSFTAPYSEYEPSYASRVIFRIICILIIFFIITISCFLCRKKIFCKTKNNAYQSVSYKKIDIGDCLIGKDQIVSLRKLGEGYSAVVVLANYTKGTEMKNVAVKYVRREICTREDMLKEVEELSSCKHSNIVSFIGWIDEDNQRAIVTEFMAGGDLHGYLVNPQQPLTISNAFSFIFQILDAMFYLSHKHILHRDLAARNCLLNETFTTLKISDFGLARKMNMDYVYFQENQRALAFRWMSPEAITSNLKFTIKLDIWSFAILLWEIFMCGAVPYDNLEKVDVVNFLNEGKRLPRPHFCPLELYNVMLWCWDESPDDRPNFDALKSDIRALYSHIEIYESRTLNQSIRSMFNANGYEIPKA